MNLSVASETSFRLPVRGGGAAEGGGEQSTIIIEGALDIVRPLYRLEGVLALGLIGAKRTMTWDARGVVLALDAALAQVVSRHLLGELVAQDIKISVHTKYSESSFTQRKWRQMRLARKQMRRARTVD